MSLSICSYKLCDILCHFLFAVINCMIYCVNFSFSVICDIYCQFPMYDDVDENIPIPVLDTQPATILASAGDRVLLPCSVTNLGSHSVSKELIMLVEIIRNIYWYSSELM